jgi:molecular chaperone GrpE (heat shock protein)
VQEGEGTQTTADETLVPPQAEAGGQAADAGTGEATAAADPLAAMQEEAAQFKDKLLRTLADFDNFRKRSRREVDDARRSGRDLKRGSSIISGRPTDLHSPSQNFCGDDK